MNSGTNGAKRAESYINFDDPPEVRALLFPPTEIDRLPNDEYIHFDQDTINTFTYPSNVTRRKYQFDISKLCLRYNTLVCLPTGSGKTLIAAVVMMNFHRWFPKGKIIFMAPTRTLVNQQVEACSNFTDIKRDKIIIMTGTNASGSLRKNIWEEKSVFFCTPQIVNNDIDKKRLNPTKIVLLIIDEAHHARSNYAYTVVVRKVAARSSQFRVIGLSATPGADMISVQSVIYNLMVSKIVYLDENDPDIAQYQHERNIEFITVPLSTDESVLEDYLGQCISKLAEPIQLKGFLNTSNPKILTRGSVYFQMDKFKKLGSNNKTDFFITLEKFSLLLSLTSMKEKLTKYGAQMLNQALKEFVTKKKQTETKKKIEQSAAFQTLLRLTERSKNVSHPKLARLGVILEDFLNKNPESRIIVFTQFRQAAKTIEDHLKRIPIVKCSVFIGKNTTSFNQGLDESTQLEIMDLFRRGNINCIIATSVGEEGLDIGEVDLIVCYDTTASPLKTAQRMGRTGRKRNGKVIFLMAEGYEEKNLEKAESTRNYMKTQLNNAENKFALYNPEVPNIPLPEILTPVIVPCARIRNSSKSNNDFSDDNDEIQGLHTGKKDNESKSAVLSKKQKFTLGKCFGMKLKYLKVKQQPWYSTQSHTLFSHSTESNILDTIFSKEDELEALLRKYGSEDKNGANSDSSSSDTENLPNNLLKKNVIQPPKKETPQKSCCFDISDDDDDTDNMHNSKQSNQDDPFKIDDDDDDLNAPCIPLAQFDDNSNDEEIDADVMITNNNGKKTSFLTDDDIDNDMLDFDILEKRSQNKNAKQSNTSFKSTKNNSINHNTFQDFDDDDDLNDEEMIKLTEEVEKKQQEHQIKPGQFLNLDSEDEDNEEIKKAKKEIGKKVETKFLDDSDIDIDF